MLNSAKGLKEEVFQLRIQKLLNFSKKLSKPMTVAYKRKLKGHMTENTRQQWAHLHRSSHCAGLQWSQQTKAATEAYIHSSTAGSFCIAWNVFLDVLSFKYSREYTLILWEILQHLVTNWTTEKSDLSQRQTSSFKMFSCRNSLKSWWQKQGYFNIVKGRSEVYHVHELGDEQKFKALWQPCRLRLCDFSASCEYAED